MTMKLLLKTSGAAAAMAGAVWLASPTELPAATVNVSVESNLTFVPSSSSINVNDTVLWTWTVNSDDHNITSTSNPAGWTPSSTVSYPASFSHTFTTAGTFPYECTIHAAENMKGTITVAAAPNVPPTMAITNVASGTVFRTPANITLQAKASDSDATITSVQFLNGSAVLATVTSAPYVTTTGNLTAGNYAFSAVVTDSVLLKNTNSVNVIVDAPPVVTITNPAIGTVFSSPANVTFQATATSPGGSVTNVQFLVGSNVVSNRTTAPFAATTGNLSAGSYTLAAIASDNLGVQTTNSTAISVVTPVPITLSALPASPGRFQFSYGANAGLNYVIQKTTNLSSSVWLPIATNQATGNPAIFVDTQATNSPGYYRVGRVPNP